MPGVRDRNLRSGDLHEDLGLFLLKAVALVAPVPRQEDVGNDAFATLIRPEGGRRLIPDSSFLVQLKSASVRSVKYSTPDELAWITELESPLFIGRVDLKTGRIELFTTLRLHQILLEVPYEGIEFLLGTGDEAPQTPRVRRVNLGPPVHAWSLADLSDPAFLERSYAILRPHVDSLRRNRLLRGIQVQEPLAWQTGEVPAENGNMSMLGPRFGVAGALREMSPHVRRLLGELWHGGRYADLPVILAFIDMMRRWGFDPDPGGLHTMMVGLGARGPEISNPDAIRIRQAFGITGMLDLSRLPISDDDLAAVDETVTNLCLTDTPMTDAGIKHLLRLTNIARLNVSGTRMTEEGFLALSALPNLAEICIRQDQVPDSVIEAVKRVRPELSVLIGGGDSPSSQASPDAVDELG